MTPFYLRLVLLSSFGLFLFVCALWFQRIADKRDEQRRQEEQRSSR
jgi:type IV secretory pathway TrbD component